MVTVTGAQSILIVGGGTAGWMTAAALANKFAGLPISIRLVESEAIGTVGVGEATVPHIRFFNRTLGIDEAQFMRRTKATFKLGIEFCDWGRIGDRYIHPFGAFGNDIGGVEFLQHWVRLAAAGAARPLQDYSLPVQAARNNRFAYPDEDPASLGSTFSYAYQFDATLYGQFLRAYSEERGVTRIEGRIADVERRPDDGFVRAVTLDDGRQLEADLFVDCSGFRSLLVGEALGSEFENWAHWLPCDRAIALPCGIAGPMAPYTRASAKRSGWIWRIPLQHRVGNGHVYSSSFIDDDTAKRELVEQLESPATAAPNKLRFQAGKRRQQWVGNCVAIGLSAGFLEPLESTSIHLIQLAISKLIELFPGHGWDPLDAEEYNRSMALEYERVRDFLILHYYCTERDDSPFWDYCRTMTLPDSLVEKLELFRERGVVARYREGMFLEPSWIAVYVGQNIVPDRWNPLSERIGTDELKQRLEAIAAACAQTASNMPDHDQFLRHIGSAA